MRHPASFRPTVCSLSRLAALSALVLLLACGDAQAPHSAVPGSVDELRETALDRYVAAPDPAYEWELLQTLEGDGVSAHVVEMTSQSWLTPEEVERTVWKHWLTVFQPSEVRSDHAFLYITGGDNDDPAPSEIDARFAAMATATGTVVAELRMVPNQPLTFVGDDKDARWEDSLIAYGWDKYLRGGREEWLARLPMTKSAVRAMDTITDLMASEVGGGSVVDQFVVAGGSKRGWTTWTTAAVDPRVVAIVPIVIDLLNVEESFVHHWQAYGFWAPAVGDYVEAGIMEWMGSEEYRRLNELVEPFEYRDRLTMPKLLVNATGDQFFLPDSSQFYYDALLGEKHLRYVPNTGHSLSGTDAFETVLAFYTAVVEGEKRPSYEWSRSGEHGLEVKVDAESPPSQVLLWQATNPEARDFRVDVLGKAYSSTELEANDAGVYSATVEPPDSGWTAFFIELTYPTGEGSPPLKLTTEVRIVPDDLPFPSPLKDASTSTGGER